MSNETKQSAPTYHSNGADKWLVAFKYSGHGNTFYVYGDGLITEVKVEAYVFKSRDEAAEYGRNMESRNNTRRVAEGLGPINFFITNCEPNAALQAVAAQSTPSEATNAE